MSSPFPCTPRSDAVDLELQVRQVRESPLIDGLLAAVSGLLAVLNEQREILAVNEHLAVELGVADPLEALGLRPGEALGCRFADGNPDGCGSGEVCASCGAALAIVAALASETAVERDCVLGLNGDGPTRDRVLRVRAAPLLLEERRLLLLTMHDRTAEVRRAELERVFLHDLDNLLQGLGGTCELLGIAPPESSPRLVADLRRLLDRLAQEVRLQRCLSREPANLPATAPGKTSVHEVLDEVRALFADHPVARGRSLHVEDPGASRPLACDSSLLVRVVANMVTNALEASPPESVVDLRVVDGAEGLEVRVWNPGVIPAEIVPRIFQRHFSTKPGPGRGLGTHSMKLLGEGVLGGKVSFVSDEAGGTEFRLHLPHPNGGPRGSSLSSSWTSAGPPRDR